MITGADEQVTANDADVETALTENIQHQDEQHHHGKRQKYIADEGHGLVPPARRG